MKNKILSIVLFPLVSVYAAVAEDWPQWRGPQNNGVVPSGSPATEWSEDKNVKWKVEVPGQGTSTPIISGDRIFLLATIGTGKKVEIKASESSQNQNRERRPRSSDV